MAHKSCITAGRVCHCLLFHEHDEATQGKLHNAQIAKPSPEVDDHNYQHIAAVSPLRAATMAKQAWIKLHNENYEPNLFHH